MKIQIHNKSNVFFCSDPHYHHKQLVKGTSSWENTDPCRDFNSLEEHDDTLVNNINNTVKKRDVLFCLGDWNFGNYKDSVRLAAEFRNRIECNNVHLILGNHDQDIAKNKMNIQSLFSSVSHYKELLIIDQPTRQGVKPNKTNVILCHYAMRVWNKSHSGSYMLHGHSHGTLPELKYTNYEGVPPYQHIARTMDVGFDTHKEFRPYSWQEIQEIMSKRGTIKIDHHG